MEPTIVFAGTTSRSLPILEHAGAEAIMVSFAALKSDKKLMRSMQEGLTWQTRTFLDSGIFSFLRRAELSTQKKARTGARGAATWDEFKAFARTYIDYVKAHGEEWDHVIDLDCSELYGVDIEDAFRAQFRALIGDKLLPVWHAQRGMEGWTKMVQTYPYVCLSTTKSTSGESKRNHAMLRGMVREAHEAGTAVHMLGVTTTEVFTDYEIDSADSSSWLTMPRYGQVKVDSGAVTMPTKDRKKWRVDVSTNTLIPIGRVAIRHSQMAALEDVCIQHGFTLELALADHKVGTELGIRLLQSRQERIREYRYASKGPQAAS